jgi:hypothetical protein
MDEQVNNKKKKFSAWLKKLLTIRSGPYNKKIIII